jgi:hypothetical protein
VKKFVSIFVLCCLMVHMGGYHLVYFFYQYGLKQEMRSYLRSHADTRYGSYLSFRVTSDKVTDPEFEWEEENEEFRYKGEWYDVVTVNHTDSTLRVCALKDERENDLEKQVTEIRHSQNDQSPGTRVNPKFFPAFCYNDPDCFVFTAPGQLTVMPVYNKDFVTANREVTTPPPRSIA